MSSTPTPSTPPGATSALSPTPPANLPPKKREITLISHSMLFYWWPIWVLGYLFALITYMEDHRLAIVPAKTTVVLEKGISEPGITAFTIRQEAGKGDKPDDDKVKKWPNNSMESAANATVNPAEGPPFKTRVSQKAWLGPVFCTILLLTVIITNVPLRGLWSFLVLLMLLIIVLGISMVQGGWDSLLSAVGNLHIYINMAGYLFIATAVAILWFVSVFIFDRRTYMTITPGQIRVCEHIGASIRNFDTTGMSFEKQRDDMFRHWLLGFFSGDLIVRTAGAERETIRLPNVLFIGWRLEEVQQLLREKATVATT